MNQKGNAIIYSDSVLVQLVTELNALSVSKDKLCFDLEEAELAGRLATLSCRESDLDKNVVLSDEQCLRSVARSCGIIDSDDEQ